MAGIARLLEWLIVGRVACLLAGLQTGWLAGRVWLLDVWLLNLKNNPNNNPQQLTRIVNQHITLTVHRIKHPTLQLNQQN